MIDWFVYWFMFPGCIAIAAVATFSGISGAALLTPIFLIGFPLMGIPTLSTVAAIGTSLFLETSGFGTAVYRYLRLGLADLRTVGSLLLVTVPLGIIGAVLAHYAPAEFLRIGYGIAMNRCRLAPLFGRFRTGCRPALSVPRLSLGMFSPSMPGGAATRDPCRERQCFPVLP